jgi:hypothetical protein
MKKIALLTLVIITSLSVFSQKRIAPQKTVEEQLNEEYCTGMFNTPNGTYFDMLNDNVALSAVSYLNILDWLQGRVAGLQIYTRSNRTPVPYIRGSRAGVYVDEIYYDVDYLNSLAVADIAMIKIIKGPFAGGFNSPGGVIAIYTINAIDIGDEQDELDAR